MGNTRPPFCSSLTTRSIRWDPWDPHEEDDRFVFRSIKTAEGKCKLVHRLIWRNLYLRWLDFNLYHSWFDQRRHSFIRRVFRIVTVFIPQQENCYSLVIWYWPINNQAQPLDHLLTVAWVLSSSDFGMISKPNRDRSEWALIGLLKYRLFPPSSLDIQIGRPALSQITGQIRGERLRLPIMALNYYQRHL